MMIAVQELCARLGHVTRAGVATNVKRHYGRRLLWFVVVVVVVANTLNVGADIAAVAASVQLVVSVPGVIVALGFVACVRVFPIVLSYRRYAAGLKVMSLFLLAYAVTFFVVHEPVGTLLRATFVPHLQFSVSFLFIVTAVLGATISPYMFIWQASTEVEEDAEPGSGHDRTLSKLRIDNALGMTFSNLTAWFIIAVCATTLFRHGVTNIATASDAARALQPFAGPAAKLLFATGVVGLGLLAVPTLAGSSAFAVAEAVAWPEGFDQTLRQAVGFYVVLGLGLGGGLAMFLVGVDPIKALLYTAVLNGVVSVPLIVILFLLGRRRDVMGEHVSGRASKVLVLVAAVVMGLAASGTLLTFVGVLG